VASIGARGCAIDCFAARMGNDVSKVVDMLSEIYLKMTVLWCLLGWRHTRMEKKEAR
jgi:hypothetical protein